MPDQTPSSPIRTIPSDLPLQSAEPSMAASIQLATSLNERNLSQPFLVTGMASPSSNSGETPSNRCDQANIWRPGGRRRRVVPVIGARNALCVAKPVADDRAEAEIVLRPSLLAVRNGLVKVQQIDCHYAHTVRVPGFNGIPSSSRVLMQTRVGRNSATIMGLQAMSAQSPRRSSYSRNAA